MSFHSKNFFRHTYCEFQQAAIDSLKTSVFTSKSGSQYDYTETGVYRYSNHWGRVANCYWQLKGVTNYKSQNWYLAYANWNDFFDLHSDDKAFYLQVDMSSEMVTIERENSSKQSHYVLFTIAQAIHRKKDIKSVFNNDKWLRYVDGDTELLKQKIVAELQCSYKNLSEIKQSLR